MSKPLILQYYNNLDRSLQFSKSTNEETVKISTLELILDQYKEKKPSDPTILEKFHTYRFTDYKDKVIDLLLRATTVSVETMKVVREMEAKNDE